MNILIAPNSFKGSLSCADAAKAIACGVRAVLKEAQLTLIPIADGGDGLIDALRASLGGTAIVASVCGPLGERRRASYLWIPSKKTAVVEMARASGLALVPPARRRPLNSTSRGTGDLIRDAVRRGARTIILGMGGAASSDGGAGMASALGARLLNSAGCELADGAEALKQLAQVDARAVSAMLAGVSFIALADVTNPLLGPRGSARVFGPQKGASPAQVRRLEQALAVWARALNRDLGVCVSAVPGAGAAGGMGAGLRAFMGAQLVPGADWMLKTTGALKALKDVDMVITAEGRLDRTSLYGKAPVALARAAKMAGVRCVAIAGQVECGARSALRSAGIMKIVSFADVGAKSTGDAMRRAGEWAAKAAAVAAAGMAALILLNAPVCANNFAPAEAFDAQYYQRHLADNLEKNIAGLEAVLKSGAEDRGKADYLWRLCRAKVRRAEKRVKRADKLVEYFSAKADCEQSVVLSPTTADSHFWLGVALGRWGETKGLLKALFIIKPIRKEMAEVLRLDPEYGGAHVVLGQILWQVPGFAGGDKKMALAEFETAVQLSPRYTANYQTLAEAYLHFKRKDDAIRVLKMVAATTEPADPAEYPENRAAAQKLLAQLEGVR